MIDIELIRAQPDRVKELIARKGVDAPIEKIGRLDGERRRLQTEIDGLRAERNQLSITDAKTQGGKLKETLKRLEEQHATVDIELAGLLIDLPNLPSEDTPLGKDESENQTLRLWGEPTTFSFAAKEHWELGQATDTIDTERAAKVSGSRFVYLKGQLVQLQFALITHAMAILTSESILKQIIETAGLRLPATPFMPVVPPVMIRPEVFHKMARLEPKEERYYLPNDDLYLIGSAEHTLGALHMDEILPEEMLPIRYVGYSTAFRREAGTYGKDTKGILRLHQFDKLELESFSPAEQSFDEHQFFIAVQEHLMQSLGLPYRVVISCAGDLGGPNARKVDIEAWLPGQQLYRETHSADYMTDYQARRLGIRTKRAHGTELVHTNDATAFAIGRTLIAIMENYQEADGSIRVPEALLPYIPFDRIDKNPKSHSPAGGPNPK